MRPLRILVAALATAMIVGAASAQAGTAAERGDVQSASGWQWAGWQW